MAKKHRKREDPCLFKAGSSPFMQQPFNAVEYLDEARKDAVLSAFASRLEQLAVIFNHNRRKLTANARF